MHRGFGEHTHLGYPAAFGRHSPAGAGVRHRAVYRAARHPASTGGRQLCCYRTGRLLLSEKPRSLPAADKTCRYEAAPDGTARLTRAFGQTVGGTCRRYDFDFDAPAAGSDADDLHPVCGNFLEELTLPDSLQVVGSCAFYNCRKLRLLTVGTGSLTMGSDVF